MLNKTEKNKQESSIREMKASEVAMVLLEVYDEDVIWGIQTLCHGQLREAILASTSL